MESEKFFSQMEKWYLRKVSNFPNYLKTLKIEKIEEALTILSLMFKSTIGFHFEKEQYAVLKWKLAQYSQVHNDINIDDIYESMLVSPSFLFEENVDRIATAIEVFKNKRKKELLERKNLEILSVSVSPEIVIEKISSGYSLVRLLNRAHLDQETEILNHCIGKSEFYINRMTRGEYEVFSLRSFGTSVATIVYNLKTNRIEQIRKYGDSLLNGDEEFYPALIEALAEIKMIRSFDSKSFVIEPKELKNIPAQNNSFSDAINESTDKELVIRKILVDNSYRELVELNLFDLGLDQEKRFNYSQVCKIAQDLGYELCSKEEANAYFLQFPVQKSFSFYYFGMELQDNNEHYFFVAGNNGEEPIFFLYGKETQQFNANFCIEYDHKFVFKKGHGGAKK